MSLVFAVWVVLVIALPAKQASLTTILRPSPSCDYGLKFPLNFLPIIESRKSLIIVGELVGELVGISVT